MERDLERGLIDRLRSLILELGKGFAFVGSQYHLEVGGQDYYLDLLFYHLRLRCFVVIELKIEEFKPEFAGKMNFYLSAVDDQLKHKDDQPTIGIILCKGRNEVIVEYALRDSSKPMGVAQFVSHQRCRRSIKRRYRPSRSSHANSRSYPLSSCESRSSELCGITCPSMAFCRRSQSASTICCVLRTNVVLHRPVQNGFLNPSGS